MYIMKQGKMRKRLFIIIAIVLIGFVVIAYSGGYPFSISGDIRSVPS